MRSLWLLAVLTLMVCSVAGASQNYTYVDLVNKLTDLEGLAVLPQPGEKCAQLSSYDRASYLDTQTGKYMGWDANGDNNGHVRTEGDSIVAGEIEGPGCIWRIWSARPEQGHVKIYLDGATEPVVDLPFIGYFDRKHEPFTYAGLVHEVAMGQNNYVPIPFRKSCKIVLDKGWGAYYEFVYSTFPEGTTVPTFTRSLSVEDRAALDKADRFLRKQVGSDPAGCRTGTKTESADLKLAPGQSVKVADISGTRAITQIWFWPTGTPEELESALRNTSISIRWDGEKEPSVWAPIGDFFGTGPGFNAYKSLPLGMSKGGVYSFWYMPFARGAVVEVKNDGKTPFAGFITFDHAPVTKPIESLGRFHAKWHRDAFLPREPERWIDWRMLTTSGQGRYVGVALEIWNPRGNWWGEGDEKFYIDGEKFPSTFGTGSEDYFGYAWCSPALFQHAYHNQTRNDGDNVGHISVNRWHIADNVPFQESFIGDIEKYFVNDRPTLYASTVYWYLEPRGIDPYKAVPVSDRTFYVQPKRHKVGGAIEGEGLKAIGTPGGALGVQDMQVFLGGKWSGESHLWWREAKPGDKLDLTLPISKSGKYRLKARMTKAVDYGHVQLYLDGRKIGEPVDLYNDGVVPTDELSFGVLELTKGDHKLTVEMLGKNEKSRGYLFGLDYVRLEKP